MSYLILARTSTWCYKQATKLVVDLPDPGKCERPQKALQMLTNGVTGKLACPLKDYIDKLESYNISSSLKWYRVSNGKVLLLSKKKYELTHVGTWY